MKNQRVNTKMKLSYPQWIGLERVISTEIEVIIKMVIKAQEFKLELEVVVGKKARVVQNFNEIGQLWKIVGLLKLHAILMKLLITTSKNSQVMNIT